MILFKSNTNPINVCNRVMKRLSLQGAVLQVPRSRDKTYLYTLNPSTIHHKSNKIDHQLKIVDFFIQVGKPKNFLVEPELGSYRPDVLYVNSKGLQYCVEIQLTKISTKKFQEKVDQFVFEYGKKHNCKTMLMCSNQSYPKLVVPSGFQVTRIELPSEIVL